MDRALKCDFTAVLFVFFNFIQFVILEHLFNFGLGTVRNEKVNEMKEARLLFESTL